MKKIYLLIILILLLPTVSADYIEEMTLVTNKTIYEEHNITGNYYIFTPESNIVFHIPYIVKTNITINDSDLSGFSEGDAFVLSIEKMDFTAEQVGEYYILDYSFILYDDAPFDIYFIPEIRINGTWHRFEDAVVHVKNSVLIDNNITTNNETNEVKQDKFNYENILIVFIIVIAVIVVYFIYKRVG